jgi:EXS family
MSRTDVPFQAGAHDIPEVVPSGVFPLVLVVYTVKQLMFPLRTRGPMWKTIWEVVTAPSTSPSFFHGYVGDIFTSMVKVFQDIAWTICFLVSGDWLISEDLKASTRHEWYVANRRKIFIRSGFLLQFCTH